VGHGLFGRQQTSQPARWIQRIIGTYRQSTEPFGLFRFGTVRWGLAGKMAGCRAQARRRKGATGAFATGTASAAASPAALQFSPSSTMRKPVRAAPPGEINRAINLAIRPMSDLAQYGAIDVWSSPLVTFTNGAGDCEDYAIAKFAALRQVGISPEICGRICATPSRETSVASCAAGWAHG